MRFLITFLCLFIFSGCAKLSYLLEQGQGQLSLLYRAEKNEKVLKDPKVPEKHKEKIRLINKYKAYFYKYWKKKATKIYSKTTVLDQEAVTYLVISSPFDQVKAREECFPIMGCFPYIGFFKKTSADEYAEKRKAEGSFVYMRPVYAYSTLGYFTDTILSSFFYYNEFGLAELIFHELFHTIFFPKNEVDLNENLANYFGREMAFEYFNYGGEKVAKMKEERRKSKEINSYIAELVRSYSKRLQELKKEGQLETKDASKVVLNNFLKETFIPSIERKCGELKVKKCSYKKRSWNNASFAALMTYQKQENKIEELRQKVGGDLKQFFEFIEKKYQEFKDSSKSDSFSNFLFQVTGA